MKRIRSDSAFTVIELLLAATITVVLAGIMISVSLTALRIWRKSQDDFTVDTTASLILDFLERDLQGAIFRSDGNTWLRCETFDSELVAHGWKIPRSNFLKPVLAQAQESGSARSIAQATFSRSGHWLRFFTTTGGEPIAVGYQIVRRSFSGASTPDPETMRYAFFRRTVKSETTFAIGYDITAYNDLISPESTYNAGSNVIDFGIWFYRAGAGGTLSPIMGATVEVRNSSMPIAADVMVRILTEEGATLISSMERELVQVPAEFEGDRDRWWWSVAEKYSRVYVRRVLIGSAIP